ncbi:MAG TPA: TonB-dependent receptor [Rhodocyclaceae bacterium]
MDSRDPRDAACRPFVLFAALLAAAAPPALAGSAAGETQLGEVAVTGAGPAGGLPADLGANSAGYSAKEIYEQVNVINTEDIVKYSPDTMTRKRYIGDRNAIVETRTAGATSSARSLVYADGILLSNLLGNSYNYPPRWSMVSPEEIRRVDFFFGPYSAEYPGNSIGTTVFMTTRLPDKFEGDVKVQGFSERFDQYASRGGYAGTNVNALVGSRAGDWSWLAGYDHLHSDGHPMTFAQLGAGSACGAGCTATPVTGAVSDKDPTGASRTFIGAQSIDNTAQDNFKLKLGYEFSPTLHALYTLGVWQNDTYNGVQSYIRDAAGNLVTSTPSGFINLGGTKYALGNLFSENKWAQEHWMHALTLKSDTRAAWDWQLSASLYRIAKDEQHVSSPGGVLGAGTGGGRTQYFGQVNRNPFGDGWQTLDLKTQWRPGGAPGKGEHEFAFGYHYDKYKLDTRSFYTTTSNGTSWQTANAELQASSASTGQTQTQAVYAQDAWKFARDWRAILGARLEHWQASGGSNTALTTSGTTTRLVSTAYPDRTENYVSPKLTVERSVGEDWLLRGAIGRAYRTPTVTELFQALTSGNSIIAGNPALKAENATSAEATAEHDLGDGLLRVSLFEENMHDALYSQTTVVSGVSTTAIQNIDKARTRGATLAWQKSDAGIRGLDLNGSVTYARARTLENAANRSYEGKVFPGVPDWRATLVATYHPDDRASYSVGLRYSGYQAYRLDNADTNQDVFGANSRFLVADARATYQLEKHLKAAVGIDNLNNDHYYLYHPMPQRTAHAELKYDF